MNRCRLHRWRLWATSLAATVALAACSVGSSDQRQPPSTTASERPVPGEQWESAAPAELGLDAGVLEDLASTARKARSKCLLVVRDGRLAGEWYFDGTRPETTHPVFSVTKSVTSTLVGIAQDDGALDIRRPAAEWIPAWRGTPSRRVTVRNLLSNDSGREWAPDIDYSQLIRSRDMTAFATGLDQATRPGTTWAYNNSAIQTLEAVLEQSTDRDVATYARERLFEPLGMNDTFMGRDPARNTMVYSGITSTCRDLARFGVLVLNGGRWGKEQVVSTGWVEAATGRPSTRLNAAYGLLWWLNRRGAVAGPLSEVRRGGPRTPSTRRGRYVPEAPAEVFWAVGLGGQVVQVHPRSGTVVVRLGEIVPRRGPGSFGPADTARMLTRGLLPKGSAG